MFGLGPTEVVLILLVALGSLAVAAMFIVGIVLIVGPLMRLTDASRERVRD